MKNKIIYVLILSFLIFISFYYGGLIKKNVLFVNDFFVENFYNIKDYFYEKISVHFNQAEQIALLKEKNKELEKSSILVSALANNLNRLLEDKNTTQYFPRVSLVRAISYVEVNDYRKVWLDFNKMDENKNKGLIYQGYTAGIAVNKNGKTMALLQGDDQCVFSVYVGKNKLPGLVQGQNDELMVKFIPKWAKINIGDEILTSGLDNVFFAGTPVGIVEKIIDEDMYQSVVVKPYAKVNLPSYLYIVESF